MIRPLLVAAIALAATVAPAAARATGPVEWAKEIEAADALVTAGHADRAAQRLEALLRTAPPHRASEVHLRLMSLAASHKAWTEAVAHGQDAIDAWPENGWIYLPVARLLVAAGRPAAATSLCEEAIKRDPAVRLAAQDLLYQIQSGTLGQEATPSAPVRPASRFPLWPVGALAVLLAGGALAAWRWRREPLQIAARSGERVSRAAATGPMALGQTGPVTYGPMGSRLREAGEEIGHYRILRVVGSSLHSILYAAEDTRSGRPVALKQVGAGAEASPAVLQRFQKEAQSLIALSNHLEGVVQVYDYLPPATIVTEWVDGENLEEAGQLTAAEVLEVGRALCEVLAYAHAQGIVHRDIKPSNIMRTHETHQIKLLDFGIAKNASLGTSNLTLDAAVPIGTFTYMPPEQFAAPNQARPTADIYALGLTLFRLMTGELPTEPWLGPRTFGLIPTEQFRRVTAESAAIAIIRAARPGVPDEAWIAELDATLRKAFEENPGARFPTAGEFGEALRALADRLRQAQGV